MITTKQYPPGADVTHAFWVRDQVFTKEQGFSPEIEIDQYDEKAHHLVMFQQGKPFATARTFPKSLTTGNPKDKLIYNIGRVCLLPSHRGTGLGLTLMERIEAVAIAQGATSLELGAQCTAAEFYERRGFVRTTKTYTEEHCPHVIMRKEI